MLARPNERPVGDSWHVDETYLKVGGQWVYLYRSVDKQGKTVESYAGSESGIMKPAQTARAE
jgi:transposase-like protein